MRIVFVAGWIGLVSACALVASGRQAFAANAENATGEPRKVITWETTAAEVLPARTIVPDVAYHGQWLVAGDLDGDGKAEIVTCRNDKQCVTAAVAMKLDGSVLWKWGEANAGEPELSYDVPLQIYDLDGDGRNEVHLSVYAENMKPHRRDAGATSVSGDAQHLTGYLVELDGATGTERRRRPLPEGLAVADCIAFANLTGGKRATDILIKTRYDQMWAYTAQWKPLWHWKPTDYRTCHQPALFDINGDGRDDVMGGFSLLDAGGKERFTIKPETIDLKRGHLDCCEVVTRGKSPADWRLVVSCCGANGLAMVDGTGKTLWERSGLHYESIDVGRLRDDVPGPQIVADIDHRPYKECLVFVLSQEGTPLVEFQTEYGRHHRLIDWDGDGLMDVLLANARRVFNGRGDCIALLGPADAYAGYTGLQKAGDPGPLAVVADLDGDQRPEIILHTNKSIAVYRPDKVARVPGAPLGTGVNFTLY